MSKRQLTLQPCCGTAKRRPQRPKQHVYLVVDDWESGYSVRKIDIDDMDSPHTDANLDDELAEPLPDPPVVRFYSRHCRLWNFGAYGTNILAMLSPSDATGAISIFDTKTLGITLCSHPDSIELWSNPLFASVAGKHYLMVGSSMFVLGALPPPRTDEDKQLSWTEHSNIMFPFKSTSIVSFVAHPDGRSLFVSFVVHPDGRSLFHSEVVRTFSLDTKYHAWIPQGNWVMPFQGQAYFDGELDAWVGLCCYKGGVGYVCSCDVPPVADYGTISTMPAWKLCIDQLFDADDDRHIGATLLCLGGISDYCLIESRVHKEQKPYLGPGDGPCHRVLRVTKFGLKHDKNGELRMTRRTAHSYQMTEGHELNDMRSTPVAFWM